MTLYAAREAYELALSEAGKEKAAPYRYVHIQGRQMVADLENKYILLKPCPLKRDRDVRGLDFHAAASNEWEYYEKEPAALI